MAEKIQMKRGLQVNVDRLVLSEGEFAVALDTGNVYIGTTAGKIWVNPTGGTADEAVKLKTARNFSATGDVTAPAVSFDGTGNVALAMTLAAMPGLSAGTYTKLTVDTKGRVTGATQIAVSDLPGIPSSKITGLGTAAGLDTGTSAGKVVIVGTDGRIDPSLMPDIAIGDVFEAANQAAMLALVAQKGDICIRSDEAKTYMLAASPTTTLANWKWLRTPDCKVLSVNGKTGAVTLTAADVGARPNTWVPAWGDVTGKPATFTPAGHATSHKTGGADALRAADVGAEPALTGAVAKAAAVDADGVVITDSAAGNGTKKLLWSAVKATLKAYFDTLYNKYVHPAYTARAAGLYKVTVDATGHVSAATAVAKADITALGIPGQDTTYGAVTGSTNGLMVAADKSKLDGIAAGANNYSLPAATASVLGGVKVGTGLVVSSGTVSLGDIDGGTF